MKKSKIIAILLFCMFFFSPGVGWVEEKSSPILLLAANYKIKRATPPLTAKPAQQLALKKPELVITHMKWSFPLKQGDIVGKNSILNFTLKNQGTAPSGNFTIKFTCPNCPPSMTGMRKISSMAPGEIAGQNWPSPPSVPQKWSAGGYSIKAVVDPNRQVKDRNRANNSKILKFKVQAAPILKKKLKISKKPLAHGNLSKITTGKRISSGFNFTTQPEPGTTGKRVVVGFDFSTIPEPGTTGIRIVSGFDFSTQPIPGTTGTRIVTGFNFSTQPAPGTTGIRTVQGFNFTKQ
jgi:CARDB